jgi:hypothetical protein
MQTPHKGSKRLLAGLSSQLGAGTLAASMPEQTFEEVKPNLYRFTISILGSSEKQVDRGRYLIRVIGDLRPSVGLSSAAGADGICFLEAAFLSSRTL